MPPRCGMRCPPSTQRSLGQRRAPLHAARKAPTRAAHVDAPLLSALAAKISGSKIAVMCRLKLNGEQEVIRRTRRWGEHAFLLHDSTPFGQRFGPPSTYGREVGSRLKTSETICHNFALDVSCRVDLVLAQDVRTCWPERAAVRCMTSAGTCLRLLAVLFVVVSLVVLWKGVFNDEEQRLQRFGVRSASQALIGIIPPYSLSLRRTSKAFMCLPHVSSSESVPKPIVRPGSRVQRHPDEGLSMSMIAQGQTVS